MTCLADIRVDLSDVSPQAEFAAAEIRTAAKGIEPHGAWQITLRLPDDDETNGIRPEGFRIEKTVIRDLIKMGKSSDPAVRKALLSATVKMVDADNRADITAFISNALFDDARQVKLTAEVTRARQGRG